MDLSSSTPPKPPLTRKCSTWRGRRRRRGAQRGAAPRVEGGGSRGGARRRPGASGGIGRQPWRALRLGRRRRRRPSWHRHRNRLLQRRSLCLRHRARLSIGDALVKVGEAGGHLGHRRRELRQGVGYLALAGVGALLEVGVASREARLHSGRLLSHRTFNTNDKIRQHRFRHGSATTRGS